MSSTHKALGRSLSQTSGPAIGERQCILVGRAAFRRNRSWLPPRSWPGRGLPKHSSRPRGTKLGNQSCLILSLRFTSLSVLIRSLRQGTRMDGADGHERVQATPELHVLSHRTESGATNTRRQILYSSLRNRQVPQGEFICAQTPSGCLTRA